MLEHLIDDLEFSLKEKRLQAERLNEPNSNGAVTFLEHMTPEQLEMWRRGQDAYNAAFNRKQEAYKTHGKKRKKMRLDMGIMQSGYTNKFMMGNSNGN